MLRTTPRRVRQAIVAVAAPALVFGLMMEGGISTAASEPDTAPATADAKAAQKLHPWERTVGKRLDASNEANRVQATADYWTPERMANAVPADQGISQIEISRRANLPMSTGKPSVGSRSVEPTGSSSAKAARYRKTAKAGKVFFRIRRHGKVQDRVCSGAAVNSKRKNMVFTAGHCVQEYGNWAKVRSWTFVPGLTRGFRAPHGKYVATSLWSLRGWTDHRNFNYDVGAAIVRPARGTRKELVRNVGGYSIQFNEGYRHKILAIGYSSKGFRGDQQKNCLRKTHKRVGAKQLEMRCKRLTPGASGGPWLRGSSRKGKLNGVFSNYDPPNPATVRASYFGNAVKSMYRQLKYKKN